MGQDYEKRLPVLGRTMYAALDLVSEWEILIYLNDVNIEGNFVAPATLPLPGVAGELWGFRTD